MPDENEFSSHREQHAAASPTPARVQTLDTALREAFGTHIEQREVGFILFGEISAEELAQAFIRFPIIVKSVLACVNVATRAVARDLQIDFDPYSERIDATKAGVIAGYVKPFLPNELAIPALAELDRFFWTDKEMRAAKGNWEKEILASINTQSTQLFRKRKFTSVREAFELDAACPAEDEPIAYGIDIKRIESPRDIHKRADEILNKATKFKLQYPRGKFIAFVYYPFTAEQTNVESRLRSDNIDAVFFAGVTQSSIARAVSLMLGTFGLLIPLQDEEVSGE